MKAAQAATATIPIVFESVADPVAAGFADSIGHPGHNITGLSNLSADLSPKRFQYLTQMVPGLSRVCGPLQPLYVQAGGLRSYGVDPVVGIRQTSIQVDKIFKGARAAELPIEQPTRVDLVLNRRTAGLLRLTIPSLLLLQAQQVIDQ